MENHSYSQDEKYRAAHLSTVDYLNKNYGFTFAFKNNYYKCEQHDSLIIYADGRGWVWNSQGLNGSDVIQFIREYENRSYVEALDTLLGEPLANTQNYSYAKPKSVEKKAPDNLILPQKESGKYSRVFAYLRYTRKIDAAVINDCLKNKTLYQDTHGNCVFVGYDEKGSAAYASARGTLTEVKYRGECKGSNKEYSFNMTYSDSDTLYVFESPIDAMSHATIANNYYNNDNAYKKMNRLSLGGLSTVALDKYLELHPQITTLNFCLDNDYNAKKKDGTQAENHGQVFAKKCCEKYAEKGYTTRNICPKSKDFNDDLISIYAGRSKHSAVIK